jgi:hypothetical protein
VHDEVAGAAGVEARRALAAQTRGLAGLNGLGYLEVLFVVEGLDDDVDAQAGLSNAGAGRRYIR